MTLRVQLLIQSHANEDHQIRFLGDPTGKFSEALDVTFDSSSIFGNHRSKRYALLVENGKVKEAFVEPDNTGLDGTVPPPYQISNKLISL